MFVPTPQEVMAAPCVFRLSIRYSSRSLEAEMIASGEAGFIQQLAGLFGHVSEVAAVKTDTVALQITVRLHAFPGRRGLRLARRNAAYRTYRRAAGRHSDTARNTF